MKTTEKEDSKKQDATAKDKKETGNEASKTESAKETKEIKDPDTLTFEGICLKILNILLKPCFLWTF
jgi:hypothetical protein